MLSKQLLTAWTSLQSQIRTKLRILAETIQESQDRNSPANQSRRAELRTRLEQLQAEIEKKQTVADNIITSWPSEEDSEVEELDSVAYEQQKNLYQEITKLEQQVTASQEELAHLDFAPRLAQLKTALNYVQVQVTSQEQSYQEQLVALSQNYESALQKLDRVRDLLSAGETEKLYSLYQKGRI